MISMLKNKNGFTLVELAIVLMIIAIAAGIGLPTLFNAIEIQRLKTVARDLHSVFQQAKFEAVRRNSNVVISVTPAAFTPDGMAGSYQVFLDDGAGGGIAENFIRDGNEEIITTVSMPQTVSLISADFSGTLNTGFTANGLPINNRFGNLQLRNSVRWYRILQSSAGNVRIETSEDGIW